jgi:sulfur-oxidizing protein SoxA
MKFIATYCVIACLALTGVGSQLSAEQGKSQAIKDLETIQQFFLKRFPDVEFDDYANGVYALDSIARQNWEALEEFPPYEVHIDAGESYWHQHEDIYAQCFSNGPGIKHLYPRWDDTLKTVVTLPYAINLCRTKHKLPELDYMQDEMNNLVAYMASQSRNKIIQVAVQNEDAMAAYLRGKQYYFTRRGQLNFACHHCHFDNAGKKLRAETLGPALGQTTGWPTYRNRWGELGPLHRRYIGCNEQVRAAPLEAESETYRELEYFHSHMNNGLAINGPAVRR